MRALSACAVAVLIAVAGCGSQSGAGTVDPASLAPASTLAYASFELAPQGPEKAGFDAAFAKLLGPDPETRLGQAFTRDAQTSGKLAYGTDVKPWLGDTVSALVTRVGVNNADYALLIASTDDQKARAAIEKDLAGSGADSRSYRGVEYEALRDGTVNGVVDHFLVAGTEAAFRQVVDTADGGRSLASSEQWKTTVGARGKGKVGLAYVDVKAALESLASSLPGAGRVAAPLLIGMLKLHPFVATLAARADGFVVDVSSPGTPPDPRGPAAASSRLIEEMPADSWLALALPDVGQTFGHVAQALKANPLIAAEYDRLLGELRARTGIDLERDVLAATGDVGLFVRGETPRSLAGAVVVRSPRPARLGRTVRRLPALIRSLAGERLRVRAHGSGFDVSARGLPRPIAVRSSRMGAVASYGSAALQAGSRLGATPFFRQARAALGTRPTLYVAFPRALKMAAASPHHRGDGHFRHALPRLAHVTYIAIGARRDSGLDVIRAVLGLR